MTTAFTLTSAPLHGGAPGLLDIVLQAVVEMMLAFSWNKRKWSGKMGVPEILLLGIEERMEMGSITYSSFHERRRTETEQSGR